MLTPVLLVALSRVAGAVQVSPDEVVEFYGPYLFWDDTGRLTLALRGRFYEPERSGLVRRAALDRVITPALFRYMGKKPEEFDDTSRELMYERLAPFLADGESGERLKVRVLADRGAATMSLPETDGGGHFRVTTAVAGNQPLTDLVGNGKELQVHIVVPETDKRRFVARLPIPPRRLPLLVISDVDDTVRVGEVTSRPRMIERVFLRRYEAVPGMSALYQQLADRGAEFHYVSGSPWQIARVIEDFLREAKFPRSVLHCRQISWDFWNSDPLHTKEFKVATIEGLLDQFDSCQVLLVGDDGEHDPEVYDEVVRRHPLRVAGIWIRRVQAAWDPARLARAADQLGSGRVLAFEDAGELTGGAAEIQFER